MTDQLGFGDLLAEADITNRQNKFDKETAHLPDTMDAAIAYYRRQIEAHHTAMLDCDFDSAIAIREDAHLLASKLNGGRTGIIADDNAPGCVLARETAAPDDEPPLWGQDGCFLIERKGTAISITMEGMFGIGATSMPYAGFSAHVVDPQKPFISQTGYRSFLGASVTEEPGMTPKRFAERVIAHYVQHELKGRLLPINERFRKA